MGLMSWTAPRETIALPGGDSFTVRGLCLNDITALWSVFGEELFEVFQGLEGLGTDEDSRNIIVEASLMAWLGKMAVDFPEIVGNVIAVASDEKGELSEIAAQVGTTPVTVQIDALMTIYRLTVTEAGGSKKLVDHLSALAAVVTGLLSAKSTGTGELENLPAS